MALTAFMFGYWGWGASTPLLLEATAAVEEGRGFAPPCFVDIRVSRSVRAAGFREAAFEQLAGPDRYVWMPRLGNRRVAEGRTGIEIVEPAAAEELLDLLVARARKRQRIVFFCACEWPGTSRSPTCHRRAAADLLARATRGQSLSVGEWPGGTPRRVDVAVSRKELARPGTTLRSDLPMAEAAGLPWGSTVIARCGADARTFRSGPARPWRGELVLPKLDDGFDARRLGVEWPA